jgi:hypothetical protein
VGTAISTEPGATSPWQGTPVLANFSYPESPTSISCASTSLCVIVRSSAAMISTNPDATNPTWTPPAEIDAVPAGALSVLGAPNVKGTNAMLKLLCTGQDLLRAFQIYGNGAVQECSGSATLSTTERLSANGRVVTGVGPTARTKRSRTVTIGQTTLGVMDAGDPASTYSSSVALNATGTRLLAKFKRLPATLSVSAAASELRVPPKTVTVDTARVTFKAKAARHRTRCHRTARAKRCKRRHHR